MADKPEPSRQQVIMLAVIIIAGLALLFAVVLAANKSARNTLQEHCRTEGTASYRGALDNDRAADYIRSCK